MTKRTQKIVTLNRVEKDKNGRPIPIYKVTTVQKSQLVHDIDIGKKEIKKVKL